MPAKSLHKKLGRVFRRRRETSPAPSSTQSTAETQSPESGSAELGEKPHPFTALNPCNPPSAADANQKPETVHKASQPSTDPRATNNGAVPTPPQAPSPDVSPGSPAQAEPMAPNSAAKDEATAIPTSQRLWNAAFDALESENPDLVKSYLKTLRTVLTDTSPDDASATDDDTATALHDPAARQMHMKKLVHAGQAKITRASKVTNRLGAVADTILSVKGIIDLAVQSSPQAALPWAGVCVGLQMLLNPALAKQANLAGMSHVIARMEWYCALSEHLLDRDNIARGNEFQAVLDQLEGSVIKLYEALLSYQMKSICSYYRNQFIVFLRGTLDWDDWQGQLKQVTDAEDTIRNDSAQYLQEQTKTRLGELVKHGEGIQMGLGDIHKTLQDFISMQKDVHRDAMEAACRRDLRVVDPQHDMQRIERNKDKLLDDAYKWILFTPEYASFSSWDDDSSSDDPQRRLFWIKGHAGTGKTMLMIGIIRELSRQPIASARALSFFFCQATDITLNNATTVLRSLLWLLLLQQPFLISHLSQKYKESGANLFEDQNAFFALSEVFRNILQDSRLLPVYLAVDALDECTDGRSDLIHLISTSLSLSPKVKWLLSSRPEVDLVAELQSRDTASVDIFRSCVELDTQRLEKPVNAYIDHKLKALARKKGYGDARIIADVSREVRQRAENTFLWVALAFKELEKVHGRRAVQRVRDMPSGLSELYDHMMTRLENGELIDPEDCKTVLVVTSLAFRPLSLSELSILTDLPSDITEEAVELCGSFLTVTKETVNLIHQSAKDYLEKNYESKIQQAGPAQGHADIGRRSVHAMLTMLGKNMYDLDFGSSPKDVTTPHPDPLGALQYSCVYWADHLTRESPVCKRELMDGGPVFRFMQERFLQWLESLSVLERLPDGILAIKNILQVVRSQQEASLRLIALLEDADRFVLSHASIIERAPLQLYGSALIFSPTTSEIRQLYWNQMLPCIKSAKNLRKTWGTHRQTLDGHTEGVEDVAYSHDGKTLASASRDRTIKLWNAATGTCRRTLEGHSDGVYAVAFSNDGTTLASGSGDGTVRLWDAVTGTYRQTLEGHGAKVNTIAISRDSTTLISGSVDRTVRVWDVVTGVCQQVLEWHARSVNAVAISRDGTTIASASEDYTICLWHWKTGMILRVLDGHTDGVNDVAISPDDTMVASASDDTTIRLWDMATGEHQKTLVYSADQRVYSFVAGTSSDPTTGETKPLIGHQTNSAVSVAFSPDGKTVASSSNSNIRIWDTATGELQQKLEEHSNSVLALAFSPDGTMLTSASFDNTIRLWDIAPGKHQQADEHNSVRLAAAFSHDGATLVACAHLSVWLWDTATGTHRQTLEGHGERVNAVAFSRNGVVATALEDNTIWLWDAETGVHQHTLEGHVGSVNAVAFSRDGAMLASASDDETIRVWDTATGTLLKTVGEEVAQLSHTWYRKVAFSHDGTMIVAGVFSTIMDEYGGVPSYVEVRDVETGTYIEGFDPYEGWVHGVAFSYDGKLVASALDNGTLRLLEVATGEHLQTMEGQMNAVAFSREDGISGGNPDAWNTFGEEKPAGMIYVRGEWVARDGKNLLWLPYEFRSGCEIFGTTLAIPHGDGNVMFIYF